MIQVGLHSASDDGGWAESQTSAVFDNQDCQSRKMEVFGRMAAGMADDFSNLLTVIAGYSNVLLGLEGLPADGRRSAQAIKQAAERVCAVTRQLLSFGRRDAAQQKSVALASLIEGIAPLLRRLLGGDIALETVVMGEATQVMADPVQLEWMFMSLAANARDAMPGGGSHRIEVQRANRGADDVARVSVMGAATQARLSDPFFTAKLPRQGSGLSLASVYEVVAQSHGAIRVTSEAGRGTLFTIDLPAATEPAEQAGQRETRQAELCGAERVLAVADEEAVCTGIQSISCGTAIEHWRPKMDVTRSASAAAAGKEATTKTVEMDSCALLGLTGWPSVLVVDNEPSVRRLLNVILQGAGYRVMFAANGAEARTLIALEEISLILCDVSLQNEPGLALVRDLLRYSPRTVALMMSGGDEADPAHGMHEAGIYGYIARPFDAKPVANRIAQVLCGRCLEISPVYGERSVSWQRSREFTNA